MFGIPNLRHRTMFGNPDTRPGATCALAAHPTDT